MKSLLKRVPSYELTKLYFTPDNVAEFVASIGMLFKHRNILDPACGIGNILQYCDSNSNITGIDYDPDLITRARELNSSVKFEVADSLSLKFPNKYDLVLSHFPFGRIKGGDKYEKAFLEKCLTFLDESGVLVCVVPRTLLFAQNCENLRKRILDEYSLEMIVDLPRDIFSHTFVDTSILVIKKAQQRGKVFLRLFEKKYASIMNEYRNQSGDIWVPASELRISWARSYFDPKYTAVDDQLKGENIRRLGEIAEVHRGHLFRLKQHEFGKYLVLNPKNIQKRHIVQTDHDTYTDKGWTPRFHRSIAQENDIIVTLASKDKKIYHYRKGDPPVVVSHNCAIIRSPNSGYIGHYLSTDDGLALFQAQVERKSYGSTVPYLSIANLKRISIPILPLEDPNIIVDEEVPVRERYEVARQLLIEELEAKGWEVKTDYRKEKKVLDIALFHEGKMMSFVEIKKTDFSEGDILQLSLNRKDSHDVSRIRSLLRIVGVNSCFVVSDNIFQIGDSEMDSIDSLPTPDDFIESLNTSEPEVMSEVMSGPRLRMWKPTPEEERHFENERRLLQDLPPLPSTPSLLYLTRVITELKSDFEEFLQGQRRIETTLGEIVSILGVMQDDITDIKASERDIEDKLILIGGRLDNELQHLEREIGDEIDTYKGIAERALENWHKLDPLSKDIFPTAEFLFDRLGRLDDMDFSPVVLQYCRTLENELLRKLFADFTVHLVNKQGEQMPSLLEEERDRDDGSGESKTAHFARVIKRYASRPPEEIKYTLGEMYRYLSLAGGTRIVGRSVLLSELRQFIETEFDRQLILSQEFLQELQYVIEDFRNRCAHPDLVSLEVARECKDKVPHNIDRFLDGYGQSG